MTSKQNTSVAALRQVDNAVYITLDAPLVIDQGKVRIRAYLASERPGGRSSGTPQGLVELPVAGDRPLPPLGHHGTPDLRPLSDYRYHDNLVKLEKLADKGLTYESGRGRPSRSSSAGRGRWCPLPPPRRKPGQAGSIQLERVPVALAGRGGRRAAGGGRVVRTAAAARRAVRPGPAPRAVAPAGEEVPAQFTATSFWPDDSLKWVLVDFTAPLGGPGRRPRTRSSSAAR